MQNLWSLFGRFVARPEKRWVLGRKQPRSEVPEIGVEQFCRPARPYVAEDFDKLNAVVILLEPGEIGIFNSEIICGSRVNLGILPDNAVCRDDANARGSASALRHTRICAALTPSAMSISAARQKWNSARMN